MLLPRYISKKKKKKKGKEHATKRKNIQEKGSIGNQSNSSDYIKKKSHCDSWITVLENNSSSEQKIWGIKKTV